ncbi:MAG: VirB8/TrbF family protein [Nitrospirota bacterium]
MADASLVKRSEEQHFYDQGRDWETDRTLRLEASERRAWWVAGIACVLAGGLGIGLACLAPLKSTIPYVFTVDRATGNVEFVSAADDRTVMGYQELLDKHWTQKYVLARESYYFRLLQADYDTVLSLSADEVGRDYARIYDGPQARDKKFGSGMEVRVKVLSVTLHADAVGLKATVRFEKTAKHTEADIAGPPQYFIATLAYEYRMSMKGQEKDLIQNPLGYKVTSYRVDDEIGTVSPSGPMAMMERS